MQTTTQSNLGSLSTFSTDVHVVRDGQEQMLFQGDAILEGDTLLNKGNAPVEVLIPGLNPGQAASLLSIPAAGTAMLKSGVGPTGEPITEIVSPNANELTLNQVEAGVPGAELVQGEVGEMAGLVGGGLMAGGGLSFLGLGGAAALLGGGAIASGLVSSSNDNNDDPSTPDNNTGNPTGLPGVLDQVNNIVEGTPLAPVSQVVEPLSPVLDQVGSALEQVASADPTGITDLLSGLINGTDGTSPSNYDGVVGIVDDVLQSVQDSTAGSPLATLTGPLTESIQNLLLPPLDQGLNTLGQALNPLVDMDPTGLTQLVSNVLGTDTTAGSGTSGFAIPVLSELPLIGELLAGGTGGLLSGSSEGIPLVGSLPVVGDVVSTLTNLGSGGLPSLGDVPVLGDLPLIGDLPVLGGLLGGGNSSGSGLALPVVSELPVVGDLLAGISSQASATHAVNPLDSLLSTLS